MKSVAGSLRVDLAQYRELESFSAFASDLDAASRAQLDRGQRLMELLKQGQGEPYPVEQEVAAIFLGTYGHLDSVPTEDVRRFESEFLEHLQRNGSEILSEIRDSGKLEEDNEKRLTDSVNEFKKSFETSDGSSAEATSDDDDRDDGSQSDEGSGSASQSSSDSSSNSDSNSNSDSKSDSDDSSDES
jgi:F-type H+-transporting ATPase subunit alpha